MSFHQLIKPLVLVGPSGSGRAALSFRLICDVPHKFDRLISHTSRKPRHMEKDGFHFYFCTDEEMKAANERKQFITFTLSPHGHYYGTKKEQLQRIISANKIPILKVTLEAYIKNIMNEVDCHALYINVSDMTELESRLHYGPFSDVEISEKMKRAAEEQREATKYFTEENIISNHDIEDALLKIKSRLFQLY